jgi:DedD protein
VPLKNANPQLDVGEEIIAEAPKRTSNEMSKSDNSRFDKTASDSLIASKTENKVEIGGQPEKIEPSKNEKLYIQIAAFSTSERLKKLEEIVNEQKITTYVVERKKDGDSGTLFLLRSGPYKSRDEVFIAEKKLVALGLTPKIVDTK